MKLHAKLNLDIHPNLYLKIKDLAGGTGLSFSEAVRRLLMQAISDPKPLVFRDPENL